MICLLMHDAVLLEDVTVSREGISALVRRSSSIICSKTTLAVILGRYWHGNVSTR